MVGMKASAQVFSPIRRNVVRQAIHKFEALALLAL